MERNLDFWLERLRQGKHLRTMLFGQGPISFYKDVKEIVLKHPQKDSASDRIERRVSSRGTGVPLPYVSDFEPEEDLTRFLS